MILTRKLYKALAVLVVLISGYLCFQTLSKQCEPRNTHYLINPRITCKQKAIVELVICVTVSRDTFEARQVIRTTWGAEANKPDSNIVLLFFIGQRNNSKEPEDIEKRLVNESTMYNDLVMGDYIDSYRNLTLKSISSLRWVHEYCSQADFMMKVDADVYVNVPLWISKLRHENNTTNPVPFIHGHLMRDKLVQRGRSQKWQVTIHEYSDNRYPDYMLGAAYVIQKGAYEAMTKATYEIFPFWIEDVYITGLCGRRAGVRYIHDGGQRVLTFKSTLCDFKENYSYAHGYPPIAMREMHTNLIAAHCER